MRVTWTFILAVVLGCGQAFGVEFRRAEPNLDDVFGASCRISVQGARGSGTFVGVAEDSPDVARILTNYHVVGRQNHATVDFWTHGKKQSISGTVVQRAYDASMPADFAIIAVDANELKRLIDPPFVALGGRDAQPGVNAFFLSSGGPKGWAVKAWKGQTLGYYNGATALFQPHPVPGQSGSGVFEIVDNELFQTGIITWLIGTEGDDNARGGAIPIANLYRAFKGEVVAPTSSPIPPGAKECSDDLRLLYFRQDNCPPCDLYANEVPQLEELAPLEVVDAASEDGYKRAVEYGVTELPTLVIVSSDKHFTVTFEDMKKTSLIEAAKGAIQGVHFAEAVDTPAFALRPPVREQITPENAGLLDDSEKRWNNRGKTETPEGGNSGLLKPDTQIGSVQDAIRKSLEAQTEKLAQKLDSIVASSVKRNLVKIVLGLLAILWFARMGGAAGKSFAAWVWKKVKLAIRELAYRVKTEIEKD